MCIRDRSESWGMKLHRVQGPTPWAEAGRTVRGHEEHGVLGQEAARDLGHEADSARARAHHRSPRTRTAHEVLGHEAHDVAVPDISCTKSGGRSPGAGAGHPVPGQEEHEVLGREAGETW
eukprot:13349027-Alexandrium_andersonii.AAC.1